MAEMPSRTAATKRLMDCPACHQPIQARLAMDLEVADLQQSPGGQDHATVVANISLVGLSVSHDCTPKTTRNTHPERTTP